MPVYEIVFPAVTQVYAANVDEAKKKGADRAGFNYFTFYEDKDVINIKIVTDSKLCPKCKFYIAPINRDVCYDCRSG